MKSLKETAITVTGVLGVATVILAKVAILTPAAASVMACFGIGTLIALGVAATCDTLDAWRRRT